MHRFGDEPAAGRRASFIDDSLQFTFDRDPGLSVAAWKREKGGLDLIVVDYSAADVGHRHQGEPRDGERAEISRCLKAPRASFPCP